MKNILKILIIVLTIISSSCEKESITNEDEELGIEQQGVDRGDIERPGNQGGN